jgi:uncharacterized protein (TIGR02246 family)
MNSALDAVAERRREWVEVVNDGSVERYADLVTADVVWLPPAGEPITSRQAFRDWLEPFFAGYAYRFSVEPTEVRPFDGWCAELGNFRSALSAKSGGEPQEHGGRYFALWRLDPDGAWRIERYVDGVGGGA